MRLSTVVKCVIFNQLGTGLLVKGSKVKNKIDKLQRYTQFLVKYPPPKHCRGVKDLDLQWIAGFYQGDGWVTSFLVRNENCTLKGAIQSSFAVVQSIKSYYIIQHLSNYAPLVGNNNYILYEKRKNKVSTELKSHQQLSKAFINLKNLFVGDKWFDFTICNYISQLMRNNNGYDFKKLLTMAKYIVQTQKEFNNNTSEKVENRTGIQKRTQNQKDILKRMVKQAEILGISVPEIHCNELIPYKCYMPKGSLNERFILGFIEAEGCFHVRLHVRLSKYPLVQPRLKFALTQKGEKNKFILVDILDKFGGKGHIRSWKRKLNQILDDYQYDLNVTNQQNIRKYVIPFFQRNLPLTAKYYDFAKFAEIGFGNFAGKNESQTWVQQAVHIAFSMNKSTHGNDTLRENSIQQYLFYMNMVQNQNDVHRKQKNMKIYKLLIFGWITMWRNLNSGTDYQKKSARRWFQNLKFQDFKLDLNNYDECQCDVVKVLDFVACQVSSFEIGEQKIDVFNHSWLYQYLQSESKDVKLKCQPLQFVLDQIEFNTKHVQSHMDE